MPDNPIQSNDFIKLKDTVMEQEGRLGLVEQAIATLTKVAESNERMTKQIHLALFGGPSTHGYVIGCQERQRDQGKFQRTLQRAAWMVAVPVSGAAVGGIILMARHLLAT